MSDIFQNHASGHTKRPSGSKRSVRFADGEDPVPLSKMVSRQDAANAVSVEFLASQAAQSNAPEGDIREVPCPDDAITRLAPTRRRNKQGWYLRYPPIFGLAYQYDAYSLYRHLRARGQDSGRDQNATLAAFRSLMATELGIVDGMGFGETVEQGRLAYTFLMSYSDCPETLPYPHARIEKFQELLGISDLPRVVPIKRPDVSEPTSDDERSLTITRSACEQSSYYFFFKSRSHRSLNTCDGNGCD